MSALLRPPKVDWPGLLLGIGVVAMWVGWAVWTFSR